MAIEIEAVYENGNLKPDRPLPLHENQRVKVIIEAGTSVARRSYGLIGWTGDPEVVRQIAIQL